MVSNRLKMCQFLIKSYEINFIKLIKNYDEESDEEYILEINVAYSKDLHDFQSDLPFLPERMKINK